jgi:hypothetical protein
MLLAQGRQVTRLLIGAALCTSIWLLARWLLPWGVP